MCALGFDYSRSGGLDKVAASQPSHARNLESTEVDTTNCCVVSYEDSDSLPTAASAASHISLPLSGARDYAFVICDMLISAIPGAAPSKQQQCVIWLAAHVRPSILFSSPAGYCWSHLQL